MSSHASGAASDLDHHASQLLERVQVGIHLLLFGVRGDAVGGLEQAVRGRHQQLAQYGRQRTLRDVAQFCQAARLTAGRRRGGATGRRATGDPIVLPQKLKSDSVDYECELAVVISKAAGNVSKADAFKHVLGYTCANDVSARDWQKNGGGGQW